MCPGVKPVHESLFKKLQTVDESCHFLYDIIKCEFHSFAVNQESDVNPLSISFSWILPLYLNDIPLLFFLVSMNEWMFHALRLAHVPLVLGRETGKHGLFRCLQQTDTQRVVTSQTRTSWENDEKQQRKITKKEWKKVIKRENIVWHRRANHTRVFYRFSPFSRQFLQMTRFSHAPLNLFVFSFGYLLISFKFLLDFIHVF